MVPTSARRARLARAGLPGLRYAWSGLYADVLRAHALAANSLRLSALRALVRDVPALVCVLRRPGSRLHAAPGTAGGGRLPAGVVAGAFRRRELAGGDARRLR